MKMSWKKGGPDHIRVDMSLIKYQLQKLQKHTATRIPIKYRTKWRYHSDRIVQPIHLAKTSCL